MELKCSSSMHIFADKRKGPFKKIIELSSDKIVEIKLRLSIAYLDIDIFAHGVKFTFRLMLDLKPEYESRVSEELKELRKCDEMSVYICTINSKDLQNLSDVFAGVLSLTIEAGSLFYSSNICYTEKSSQNIIEVINVLTQNYQINTVVIEHIYDLFLQTSIKCNKICIRKSIIEHDEDLYIVIDLALLYFEKTDDIYLKFNYMSAENYEKKCQIVAAYLEDQPYKVSLITGTNCCINIQKNIDEF